MRFGNTDQPRGPVGPRQGAPLTGRSKTILGVVVALLVLIQVVPRLNNTYTEFLWFGSLDATQVFRTEILTRIALFLIIAILVAGAMIGSATIAYRKRPVLVRGPGQEALARYQNAVESGSKWMLAIPPVLIGLLAGLFAQSEWQTVIAFFNSTPFGVTDPQFGMDISFYAFQLGFWRFVLTWVMVLIVLALLTGTLTHYVFGGIRIGAKDGVFSKAARIHLAVLAGLFVLAKAVAYWFDRYELMYSEGPTFTGAGYTDVNAVMPAKIFLFAVSILCAIAFFAVVVFKDLRIPAIATVLLIFSAGVVGSAYPLLVEQFSVNPNRAEKEREYIERNIAATRDAFGVGPDKVNYDYEWGQPAADPEEASETEATLENIRVLDPTVLSPTFTQQQQLRNFFGFPDELSIDRYDVGGEMQDYVVGAREINPNTLRENQQDWINRRTVYTHGTGLVMAPADRVNELADDAGSDSGGFPSYTSLDVSGREGANAPAELEQPRIYYGPLVGSVDDDYAIVNASGDPREYDTDTERYTYSGEGGVQIGGLLNRLAFSLRFTERNILFSDLIDGDSKVVFDRDPMERVEKVAPWLTTDEKTYPTIVDGQVKWIVDGYTTLDSYPYGQRVALGEPDRDPTTGAVLGTNEVSYARNSVKAVVDAYDGSVELYEMDEEDPVLKTWSKAFPGLVKPHSEMSEELQEHLRYPEDLFNAQRQLIAKYHVSDPSQFFTNDAFWSIPADLSSRGDQRAQQNAAAPQNPAAATNDGPTGGIEATDDFVPQPSSYVVAADPKTGEPSFQLQTVFRGFQREIFAAHMTASSDPSNYGELTVRAQGPSPEPRVGPTQAQNSMLSAPRVAEDRRLWTQTARITEGNMLSLALDDGSVMYVVPIYAQRNTGDGEETSFPRLLRVMMFYDDQVGYGRSVYEALQQVNIDSSPQETGTAADGEMPPDTETRPADESTDDAGGTSEGSAPTTPAPSEGQAGAVRQLEDALGQVEDAQSGGDLADLGAALDALQKAVDAYNAAGGN